MGQEPFVIGQKAYSERMADMKITPDCNTILKLAEEYSVVPVCKEIYARYHNTDYFT